MAADLLPCPFCGGAPATTFGMSEHWVSCQRCRAATQRRIGLDDAIAVWNHRLATPAPTVEDVNLRDAWIAARHVVFAARAAVAQWNKTTTDFTPLDDALNNLANTTTAYDQRNHDGAPPIAAPARSAMATGEADDVRAAAIALLLNASPISEDMSRVPTRCLRALGRALRDQATPPAAPVAVTVTEDVLYRYERLCDAVAKLLDEYSYRNSYGHREFTGHNQKPWDDAKKRWRMAEDALSIAIAAAASAVDVATRARP